MWKTLVKNSMVFWGDWHWPSRSNLTSKSKFIPFWACPGHDSPPIEISISKFGTKMHLCTVQIPTSFGLDWNWSSIQFLISNPDQIELFMYIIVILYWDQLVWKLGELKEFGGSEQIQRTAIGTAPWHRLFHSVNVSWWDHIECAAGRRPFGLGVVMGLGV